MYPEGSTGVTHLQPHPALQAQASVPQTWDPAPQTRTPTPAPGTRPLRPGHPHPHLDPGPGHPAQGHTHPSETQAEMHAQTSNEHK
eukprot:6499691-Pyramimonas_sp.AAC.2